MAPTLSIALPGIGAFADLAAEIPLIKVIAALAPRIDALIQDVKAADPSVDTAQELLDWLGANVDTPTADAAFGALGLSALQRDLKGLKDRIAKLAPNAALLLKPVGDFVETSDDAATVAKALPQGWSDGQDPGLIAWQPTATIPLAAGTKAKLSLGLEGAIEIEAGALWPFAGDAVAPGLLRLSAKGQRGDRLRSRSPQRMPTRT